VSRRLPAVLAVAAVVGGAVVADAAGRETPTVAPAGEPGVQMPAVPASDVLAATWYCAAGTAEEGGSADHTVVVFNPGDDDVTGTISVHGGTFAAPPSTRAAGGGDDGGGDGEPAERDGSPTDGDDGGDPLGDAWSPPSPDGRDGGTAGPPPPEAPIEVPAGGRVEVRLAEVQRSPLAAALVEVDGAVAVEHEVAGPAGRDVGPCASSASPEWHLAWGATTRDAREVMVLFNPFPSPAAVDVVFATENGIREPVRFQGLPVPARGVVGVDVGEDVSREELVSATVRSRSGPVVVERLQTFDGSAGVGGLSTALAVPEPLETWVFAHGSIGPGRGERIVVYNPTGERAEVEVMVRPSPEDGAEVVAPQPFRVAVAAGRHEVIDYGEQDRVPAGTGHATVVRSSNGVPVVAERVLTYGDGQPGEVAAGPGAAFAADTWVLATRGGGDEPATRLVVANPGGGRPARVSVVGFTGGQEVAPADLADVEVPPGDRRVLTIGGELDADDLAVVVRSDQPVVVERLVSGDGLGQAAGPAVPVASGAVPVSGLEPSA